MSQVVENTPSPDIAGPKASGPVELTSLPTSKKARGGVLLEVPGQEAGSWQRWHFAPDRDPELLEKEAPPFLQKNRVIALPSSSLFAWPLWVASEGNVGELVRMELSGRHLLKRGMEEALEVLTILRRGERILVLAVAPDSPFAEDELPPDWKDAARFELPARLHAAAATSDLILWREWGTLQIAFYREGKVAWFCGIREEGLRGTVLRMALRLLSEGVIERMPGSIQIEGLPQGLTDHLAAELGAVFPKAEIFKILTPPSPLLKPERRTRGSRRFLAKPAAPHHDEESFDLSPPEARVQRLRHLQRGRIRSFATVGALLYLLLLVWGAGDLLIRRNALHQLKGEIIRVDPGAVRAKSESERWHALRTFIDPTTYALDLLAAVATATEGGKVRLTEFSLEPGRLRVSGEATDVTQAYAFIEALKKNPLLQEMDLNAGQPHLAGKNSVKFDMEGTRRDTTHETTGSK